MSDKDESMSGASGMDMSVMNDDSTIGGGNHVLTQQEREEIAKAEDRAVLLFRGIVVLVLLVTGGVITYGVHRYMNDSETQEFETRYHSDADKIITTFGKHMDDTFGAADAFGANILNQARQLENLGNASATWPFFTATNYAMQAAKFLRLSNAYSCSITPVVYQHQKDEWENYALQNLHWLEEAFDVMESDETWEHEVNREYGQMPIFSLQGPVTNASDASLPRKSFAPTWVQYPAIPQAFLGFPYNFDSWSLPLVIPQAQNAYLKRAVAFSGTMTGVIMDPNDPAQVQTAELFWDHASYYVPKAYGVKEPAASAIIPLYNAQLDRVKMDTEDLEGVEPVAYFSFAFFFKELLRDMLPENSKGVHMVVHSACGNNSVFTYQLDGAEPVFLGAGDLHETEYDEYVYSVTFGETMGQGDSHYTGLPWDDDFCTKTMKIFPSRRMEDEYRTNTPLVTTLVSACIFGFCLLVFVMYDAIVARRQKIVLGRALASGAIVNSLFPAKVRQQLYDEKQAEQKRGENEIKFRNVEKEEVVGNGPPIAHLHENTTIFFADVAGFTKWSSSRSPVEVFQLLETLYSSFDFIAKRRGVFKVETIGDCYVAVTGIPNEQPDHAVRMVKFARDCRRVMAQKINELTETLGEDTSTLDIRVGLHSGPTTAGVLRGERSRFQLFGDTVNTASRMESNGVPGKIHVSEATAEALREQGKGDWCVARPDKVSAKGKGLMQTYFVEMVPSKDRSRFSSSGSSVDGTSPVFDNSYHAFSAPTISPPEEDKDELEQRLHARLGSSKDALFADF